ncbi:uncharacterized protein [Pyxicephalus adspersus]|uniref:uncharacterized protein n=1 Tax=Pyxicephalus adspersus TaxID=30357 RepID=UPI003B5B00C5
MALDGKSKMKNLASFIKEHFNIVGNSLLAIVLLGLEKLMDLEFICPNDKPLAICYSLVFIFVPTLMVGFVAWYFNPKKMCCKTGEKESNTDIVITNEDYDGERNTYAIKNENCRHCFETLQHHFFPFKAVVIWGLIVITDGRYGACFVKSVYDLTEINHSNISSGKPALTWRELSSDNLIQVFQIIGLLLIFLIIIVTVCFESKVISLLSSWGCKWDSEAEKIRKMNEDILLQITEDTIQEEARQRQKEFVVTLLSREDWGSYNPGLPNAQEELDKITAKWKEELRKHHH